MKKMRFNVELMGGSREAETIIALNLQTLIQMSWGMKTARVRPGRVHAEFEDVREFQEKFKIPMSPVPAFLDKDAYEFRVKFMQEELDEFLTACDEGNMAEAADALGDLVYVAMGLALMMGLPWPEVWDEIQKANLTKVRATEVSQSKRGSLLDVVKPEGFVPPDHKPALEKARMHAIMRYTAPSRSDEEHLWKGGVNEA